MFKIAIVIFRECLEISFLLGVILAVTKPIKDSRLYVVLGSVVGVVAAALFAMSARAISTQFGGLGDELFNAGVILVTALIISWTVVWMQGYTKKIRRNLTELSEQINAGSASKLMLVFVVATAIMREGVEIILFVYSIASAQNIENTDYIIGLGLGAFSGFAVGTLIYLGLVKYAGKYVFKICTILLMLIAAGLAAQAAGILTSAGIIDIYNEQLWNTSWLVSDNSITGKILNITIGYDAQPNGMQILFYVASILITLAMMRLRSKLSGNITSRE